LERALAVSPDGTTFVTDGENVYAVRDGSPSLYLSGDELRAVSGSTRLGIEALAVGPDERLYALDRGAGEDIYVSGGPHRVEIFADVERICRSRPEMITVATADEVLVSCHRDGLVRVARDSVERIFTEEEFAGGGTDCAGEWLAAAGDQIFYASGCTGDDAFVGTTSSPRLELLLTSDRVESEILEWGFAFFGGIAPHPTGGVVINADAALVHLDADATLRQIPLEEPYDSRRSRDWHAAPIGVDASGRVHLLARDTLYTVVP
jgi:hypothetical protein